MEKILLSPVWASNVCCISHRRNLFVLSLSLLYLFKGRRMCRHTYWWRWPLINAVECIWKIGPTKPYSYNSRKHTHSQSHTHGWMDVCDLWSVCITDTKLLWHHRTHTCKLCATCTSCNTHAIRKQGKSAFIPHTSQKCSTMARTQDCHKHASQTRDAVTALSTM